MAQNPQKKGKIYFDAVKPDFCWVIGPDFVICDNEENYRKLLRSIYRFDPAADERDIGRFAAFDK